MGILTAAAGSCVSEIVKETAIVRHIGYSFCFKKIVRDLTEEKVRLEQRKQVIHDTIHRGVRNNTEVANPNVQAWRKNVDRFIEEVQTLENLIQEDKICCMGCPDWIWRYKLGKEATKKTEKAAELFQEAAGWDFNQLTHRDPLPDIVTFSSNDDYEEFQSRKFIFEELMEALRDDNCKRIGLHGLGGVGKTTLVMNVCKKAKDLFSDIVKTTVSQTPDITKIQVEIAECLNLKLDEEKTDSGRAKRIWLRIKQAEKKILIILDDVWKDVKLEDIGIPSGEDQQKCKILLTTRSEHVCNLMHCSKKILLKFLSEEESLALIKKNAIIFYDSPALNDVVKKVVEECKGLPIAIVTVGKALTGKSLDDWKEALQQLRKSRLVDIYGVDEEKNAYSCLKWSYNHLKCKAKLCFLLCSLFPEDYYIDIEELTRYAMGLEEYEDVNSLDEARSQVRVAINQLQDSSLLLRLSSIFEGCVKMHDMVRDVGLWIASKGENEFKLRACTHLEKNMNFERVTTISLMASNTKQLPDKLVCPRLNILLLGRIEGSKKISNTFFEGLNCLKVLRLEDKILSSHSLQFLTNLQSLYLINCDFSDNLSSMGKLKRLETLSFRRCEMVALPNELGEMESLRLLDLRNCYKLEQIPQNVIQRLSRLEELIMNFCGFKNWDVEGTSNANLSELNSLPFLVSLYLPLELKCIPQGFVFPSLQRYRICINCSPNFFWEDTRTKWFDLRALAIKELNFFSMNSFKVLFRTVEYIWIESCEMECIVDTTSRGDHTVMFANLIKLHLVKMSCLRTICEGPNHFDIFNNLTDFVADGCTRLVTLFSPSLAQSLKKLKNLRLVHCNELKQIISEDEGMILESHSQPICLPELQTIQVCDCGKLEYIFPLLVARDLPKLESLKLEDLPQLKQVFDHEKEGDVRDGNNSSVWPSLKDLKVVKCPKMKWSCFADLEANVAAHGKLQKFWISYVDNWNAISIIFMQFLLNLEELKIENCGGFQEVFKLEGLLNRKGEQKDMFPSRLKRMQLHKLLDMKFIWKGPTQLINLNHLEKLQVFGCKKLIHLFTLTLAQSLQNLKCLEIDNCDELEHLIVEDENDRILSKRHLQTLCFTKLDVVKVNDCKKLKCLFLVTISHNLLELSSLEVEGASQLVEVFAHEDEADKLVQKDVTLPKLKDITLERLPSLLNFFPRNYHVILPDLHNLKVKKCPNMTTSFSPALDKTMHVNGELQKLRTLDVDDWNAISVVLMQGLLNLEILQIKNCGGLLEVFKLEGLLNRKGEQKDMFPSRLKRMRLHKLLDMRFIWKGPTQLINLNHLEKLQVFGCKKLIHLFTLTLAQSLQNLKCLKIDRCDELEHLIVEDENDRILSKRHLQILCFPKLDVVKVKECNKLKCLFPVTISHNLLELSSLKVKTASQLVEVFTHEDEVDNLVQKEVTLPKLEDITLGQLPSLLNFFPRNYHVILPNLHNLKVKKCPNMTTSFSPAPDKAMHVNGEELQEVFKLEGLLTREGEQQNMVLLELKKMVLCNLLELRCIWKGPTQLINLKNLENLKVFGCKKLIHLFTPTLARSLQNLTLLEIERCDELEHLIVKDEEDQILLERHLQTLCFPNLLYVKVTKCNKLKFLFPVMIAHNLLKLSSLNVEDASQLVEVFAHEDEGDKSIQKDITLPKLNYIALKRLPSLINFCPKNYHAILLGLHKLQVQSCPNMTKSFAPTPDKNVHVNGELQKLQTLYGDDCNALSVVLMQGLLTLEELEVKNCGGLLEVFKLEGLLTREGEQQNLLHPRLKKIFLHDLLELRCIWKGPTQYLNLDNLEELEVFGCNKLKHLFTPILAQSLQSLKWLEIRTCDEVEYLIAKDEEDQILSKNHLQPFYFPKLKIVSVKGCNKLKYLFPITMADSLLKLTILKVKGASQLVEVFANEDKGDIVVQKDVRLPQICKISLKGLPSLVNFCPRNYHAILPKLYCLKVQRCPNMTTKFTRTPNKSVHINGEVPQVDEEDESIGFSTNSSVVTLWPPNKDEGDADNDDLEWDDADLMGRRRVTYPNWEWMSDRRDRRRMKDEDDHVANNDDSDSEDADYNLLECCDDDSDSNLDWDSDSAWDSEWDCGSYLDSDDDDDDQPKE